jgi:trimeric autotransporter adhesin
MKKILLSTVLTLVISGFSNLNAQIATVFNEDFATSAGSFYTLAPGPIGTSTTWNLSRSGTDFGAGITSGRMILGNDGSAAGNFSGWALGYTNTSNFTTPYNTTLNSNTGDITWTFNVRQPQANPSGFTSGNYGVAFILAGTSGTTNSIGTGYAVTLGNSGKTDPLRLVSYSAGLQTSTTIITSNTSGLSDFGNPYLSVKVVYTPSTNTWKLYVRNDGTVFLDPNSGSLTLQGSPTVNNTYTGAVLPIMGGFWNASTKVNQSALFDNVKVTIAVPNIVSLAPPSKTAGTGAFTLTVNGTNFVNGTSIVKWNGSNRATTFISSTQLTASILASDITIAGTAAITVANGAAISNSQNFTIDPADVPNIALSTSGLNTMTTITGTPSSGQTYTVSGSDLTGNVDITAPTNFEISTNGTTYFASLSLIPTGGNISATTIYARVKASAPSGIYSDNITHATSGGVTKEISVTATVLASKPTTQATTVNFTTVTSTTFTVNWTNGNGTNHLVLIKSGSAVNSNPVDGTTYTEVNSFGAGSEIGTGNYVIYAGASNTVNVTGLQPNTVYHVAVFEYNGSDGTESYLTTTPARGNRTTLNAPVGWQIYATNAMNAINFDTTVDGVNEGSFEAAGLSPALTNGELNSNAWAITGFSDGAIAFGGTSTDGQDFDRGEASGSVSTGGIYAFETSANNVVLGLQPATGDFAPGSVTLRFQNQTGAAVTSLSIGYKVYIYNDEAASSSFNFSHSTDNSAYTNVSGLNVISPATADASPGWKAYYRVTTLTGLNIANNNYYYFRWTGAAVSGSVDFDQFGLDDIVMVANPSTNYASFNGNAESFVVLGNTTLSGPTTVASDLTFNGGKVDINGSTLTLNGTVTNTTTGGLKGSASSNLTLGGAVSPSLSFDQTTLGTTNLLNNLSINTTAANTVTILNPMVVNGTLTTALGQILNMGTNALTGTLTEINNNGTIATQNTTSLPIPSGKTWNGTINYNAASTAQTIVVGTYQNLTSSSTGGAVAAGNLTVNGVLNLPTTNPSTTVGSFSMGSFTLTMGGSGINSGIGDVTGIVTRNSITANVLYTFGNTYTSIIFPNTGTLPTSMSLKIAIGTAPSWRPGAINRTYDFIQTGGSGTKAVIKAHYLDSELNGNAEIKLVDWAYIVPTATVLEQGRSNYNTNENWIELTNVNVGLYFQGTFGLVLLTLDESASGSLTWNGSVSDSWTTAVNWTPNATPSDLTVVYIPDAATTPNDPTLNPLVLLGSLNIESGAILNAPANSQFTINNGAGSWINNGTFNPGTGTSTVIFTSIDATIAGSTNFNNLTINSGANLHPLTDNIMQIAGTFTVNGIFSSGAIENTVIYSGANQTIPSPNGASQAYHNLVVNGTGAIPPATLNITGNLTLNQSVDFTGKTLAMLGSEPQAIDGASPPTFNNLTINNSDEGVSLGNNAFVNGILTLTSGHLALGNYNLTLGSAAVSGSFSAANMIVANETGELRRNYTGTGSYTFPIGDNTITAEYTPITVDLTAGSFSNAYVGVSVVDAIHPNNSSTVNNLTRYWKVNQSGITGAIATVSAAYMPSDLTGNEGDIGSAQLNGTFNQASNPWIKYSTLSGNTLTAAGASLTAGQVSAFTGIKGGDFTATLSGYGSFCLDYAVTLTATPTGGDAPYTYLWSGGLGTEETATPPTSTPGIVNYTVTIKDSNGITVTDNADVEVSPLTVGGTIAGSLSVCTGANSGDLILSGHTGNVVRWESSVAPFTDWTHIANTTATHTWEAISQTTKFRTIVQSGTCTEAISGEATITINSTTWSSGVWTNGAPNATTSAIISSAYTSGGNNITACSLTINNNSVVQISSGDTVSLSGALVTESGSTVTFNNNANLIQAGTANTNSGTAFIKRNSSALMRLDYTLWSSPVSGSQTLLDFSPQTLENRFYTYNTSTNLYNLVTPSSVTFATGKGYLIRMPNNHPTSATIWNGEFSGVPNNGDYNFNMADIAPGQRFNLVGNPYPSPINATAFVSANSANITGALYFWRKTNNVLSPSYCTWTTIGFTSNGEAQVFNPNNIIQTGQGFFVEASGNGTALNFNNSMRVDNHANQFFRNSNTASSDTGSNRFWLNATNSNGSFSQTLVGYVPNASQGYDAAIDGKHINDGDIALTSLIGADKFAIQGRALPFDTNDVVPLSLRVTTAGNYSIAIDHVDGLFLGNQGIFLKDNITGTIQDLKTGSYTFASAAGTFDLRFEILYQLPLDIDLPEFNGNQVIVYKNGADGLVVNTGNIIMDTVKMFDVRGRLLQEQKGINASQATINAGLANQVLLVQITSQDGITVTKKVIR